VVTGRRIGCAWPPMRGVAGRRGGGGGRAGMDLAGRNTCKASVAEVRGDTGGKGGGGRGGRAELDLAGRTGPYNASDRQSDGRYLGYD
jgi:hypothetical protein